MNFIYIYIYIYIIKIYYKISLGNNSKTNLKNIYIFEKFHF